MSSLGKLLGDMGISTENSSHLASKVASLALYKGGEMASHFRSQKQQQQQQKGGRISLPIQYFGGPSPGPYVANGSGSATQAADLARPALVSYDAYKAVGGNNGDPYTDGGAEAIIAGGSKKWVSMRELEASVDMKGLSSETKKRIVVVVNQYVDDAIKRAASLIKNKKRILGKSHMDKAMK
jgi:hypothetical protein